MTFWAWLFYGVIGAWLTTDVVVLSWLVWRVVATNRAQTERERYGLSRPYDWQLDGT